MPASPQGCRTVSIVERDPTVRDSLATPLQKMGYPVQGFASFGPLQQASAVGAQGCLILDLDSAGLDGLQIYADLIDRGTLLTVLFLTEQTELIHRNPPLRMGAIGFMRKPGEPATFGDRVSQLLGVVERWERLLQDNRCLDDRIRQLGSTDQETLQMVLDGLPNKVMACRLFISVRGVELRRQRMLRRLGVDNVAALLERTIAQRLLSDIRVARRDWTAAREASRSDPSAV